MPEIKRCIEQIELAFCETPLLAWNHKNRKDKPFPCSQYITKKKFWCKNCRKIEELVTKNLEAYSSGVEHING
ncbi:MAG: hypothetical protein HY376_03155 [Candidatus Blackburnbacteria bacterium]|nr:hypothetical protein [Candidatus Blackburnbacteria bacterium]